VPGPARFLREKCGEQISSNFAVFAIQKKDGIFSFGMVRRYSTKEMKKMHFLTQLAFFKYLNTWQVATFRKVLFFIKLSNEPSSVISLTT
jgi:hypothetical protein